MRNLYFFEKILVIGAVGGIATLLWFQGPAGMFVASIFVAALIFLYVHLGQAANNRAREAIASVNNNFANACEGTGIAIAFEKPGFYPSLKVYANGKRGDYMPGFITSVALSEDRKDVYRNLLLTVDDMNTPEWLIHFNSRQEAEQWHARVMQYAKSDA